MNKKIALLLLSLTLVLSLTSCTTFKASGLSATLSYESYDVVGYMDETINVNKFLGTSGGSTLANISEDATEDPINFAIQQKILQYHGDAIVNMEVSYGSSFFDILGNYLTFTIWAPSKVHVKGIIVKYKENDYSSKSPVFVNMK